MSKAGLVSGCYSNAFRIIEESRFKFGCGAFLISFIRQWAYLHSNMYKPTDRDVLSAEFEELSMRLSNCLCELMIKHGETDPLGVLLCEYTSSEKSLSFFPTPSGVTKLLVGMMGSSVSSANSLYEPCAGSGSIVISQVEDSCYENAHKENPLAGLTILTEDISDVMCHALFVQLLCKLHHLSFVMGREVRPDKIIIASVDVISRKQGHVYYEMSNLE